MSKFEFPRCDISILRYPYVPVTFYMLRLSCPALGTSLQTHQPNITDKWLNSFNWMSLSCDLSALAPLPCQRNQCFNFQMDTFHKSPISEGHDSGGGGVSLRRRAILHPATGPLLRRLLTVTLTPACLHGKLARTVCRATDPVYMSRKN